MTQQFNTRPSTNRNRLLAGTAAAALLVASAGMAHAQSLPTGGTVVGGHAAITQPSSTQMNIIATTDRSAINWQSFSIAQGYGVNVKQPNATSTQLENVTGGSVSQIFGSLSSNGRIVLANPNGIWFGPNAQVDVAGLVATTSYPTQGDIDTFIKGGSLVMSQAGNANAAILNQGTITVAQAGLAAFVAPGVSNQGVIQARLGTVQLASGTTPTLDFYGDGLINIAVNGQTLAQAIDPSTGQPLGAAVSNSGTISANGGTVYITANVAAGVVDQTINVSGVVQAQSVSQQNGMIVLNGGSTGTVEVAGTLDASGTGSGETGGTVKVLGNNVELASGSTINVSGDAGGGTVDVGGDAHGAGPDPNANTTTVDKGAIILANAVTSGNGGNVAVWSMNFTSFDGSVYAKGGSQSGNGGFVETSGANLSVGNDAVVDASAPNGSAGDWLLDPVNGYVTATGAPPATDPTAGAISNTAVQNGLMTNDVTLTTSAASFTAAGAAGATAGTPSLAQAGNLVVAAPITWSSGHTLTLNAWDNLLIEAAVTHTGATPATLNLKYNMAGTVGLTAGELRIYDSNVASGLNGVVTMVAGQDHLNINTQAYTLITDLSQVTVSGGNISGFYALDADLNNPATNFSGDTLSGGFEGLGHTISNLTIASATTNVTNTTLAPGIGLFGLVGSGAIVNDVGLIAPAISSTAKTSVNIGSLAGTNLGTISNSWAINGSVTGPTSQPVNNGGEEGEGGLVGTNGNNGSGQSGTILSSFTDNMTVTANGKGSNNGTFFYALGGFVGSNGGTIVGSFASNATVTSTNSSGEGVFAGGFIGDDSLTLVKGTTLPGVVAADIYFGQMPTASGNNAKLGSFTANGTCVTVGAGCTNPTLTVNLQPDTKVYDGTTEANVTPTASGLVGGDSFLFGLLEEQYSSPNVGNSIPMTLANSLLLINYGGSTPSYFYTINPGAGANGKITPAPLTITASDVSTQYGTTPVALTGFTATGLVNGQTITSVTETSADNVAAQNAGTYTNSIVITSGSEVGGNGFLASNYSITLNPGTLTITPSTSPVVITASDVSTQYGTTPVALTGFTATGLVAGNTITAVTETATANVAAQNAGTYTNNIVITPGSTVGTFNPANYTSVTYNPGTLTITPSTSPVVITANDQTTTYGNTPIPLPGTAFTVTGLVAGNQIGTVTETSSANVAAQNAGVYAGNIVITPGSATSGGGTGFLASNYSNITYNPGTLTINPSTSPVVITASDVSTQYGTTPVALTGFSVTGLVAGNQIGSVTETATANVAAQNAGTYTNNIVITPGSATSGGGTGFLASNYSNITYNPGTLTITPSTSPVVITASDVSTQYGTTPVALTGFTATGLVAGNTITAVTETATANVAAQNAGTYTNNIVITPGSTVGTFNPANYTSVTYNPGTLTITPSTSPVVITADNQSQNFGSPFNFTGTEFTVTGLVAGNTLTTVTLASAGDTATAPAGLYSIVPSAPTTGTFNPANYTTVTYVNGVLTVIAPPPQTLLCAADFPDCTVPHLPNPNVPLSQPGLSLSPGGNTPLAGGNTPLEGVNPAAGGADCTNEPNELLRRECIVRQQNQVGANYGNSYLGGQAPRP